VEHNGIAGESRSIDFSFADDGYNDRIPEKALESCGCLVAIAVLGALFLIFTLIVGVIFVLHPF